MGSAQSYISPETAVTALVIAGAIGLGYTQFGTPAPAVSTQEGQDATSKKGKKKKSKAASHSGDISETSSASKSQSQTPQPPSSRVAEFPKAKKAKKKSKGKAAAVEADVSQTVSAAIDYLSEADMEASAPSAKNAKRQKTPTQPPAVSAVASSTSSQLKRPSHQSTASIDTDGSWTRVVSNKRGRTTDADSSAFSAEADPTSDAAVERRASTSTEDESFLLNVSTRDSGNTEGHWLRSCCRSPGRRLLLVGDYEDVRVVTDGGENDADGEDDGWGVVTSKRSTTRQNAQRKENEKAAKAEAEADRLAVQKARVIEEYSGKSVAKRLRRYESHCGRPGKLVWE
ncbi:hypothetical protein CPB84DRAFT_1790024 [Gymnopilus junonius]|uniref:Uncharacterized protein n=1 Tax=Gymnopilus junonius TaxID=109634 RepID=A0A9P5TJ03_GYMJU|nr:hypothetical protein CPB84DRAFT_1790024 [Gymnopilus junonius]